MKELISKSESIKWEKENVDTMKKSSQGTEYIDYIITWLKANVKINGQMTIDGMDNWLIDCCQLSLEEAFEIQYLASNLLKEHWLYEFPSFLSKSAQKYLLERKVNIEENIVTNINKDLFELIKNHKEEKITKQKIISEFGMYYYQNPEKFRYFKIYFDKKYLDWAFGKLYGPLPLDLYNYSEFIKIDKHYDYDQRLMAHPDHQDWWKGISIIGPNKSRKLSYDIIDDVIIVRLKKDNNQETFDWIQSVGFKEVI